MRGGDGNEAVLVPSTSSLRAQRSNPESLRGKTLDCFAALAMTEYRASASPPSSTVIPREGGESSTPQLLGSITAVSEYWIARSSRAMTPSVGRTVSTPSFRAQRLVRRSFSEGGSNPESFRGGSLDCFAALAMTEQGASASFSNTHLNVADTPSRPRGAIRPSFASSLCPLSQEGAGKAGC